VQVQAASGGAIVAPTYRDTSYLAYGSRANSSISKPAAVAQNDLMLMSCFFAQGGSYPTVPTLPSGWAWVDATPIQAQDDGGFSARFNVAWKVAGASEGASYAFTHGTFSTNLAIIAFSGVNTSSPIDAYAKTVNNNSASSTRTLTGVTTTQANDMLVGMAFDWADNTTDETPPTGMTERQDGVLSSVWNQVIAAAGATGTRSNVCNNTNGLNFRPWGGLMIALKGT
jgi:hypothetical protein